jgi:hypothetical protein
VLTESLVAVSADPRVELLVAQSPGPADRALLVIHGGPDGDHTYLREAAGALLAWAERRHPGVYASIRPPNPASERVLQKIGMRLTASYTDGDGVRNVYRRRPG